MKITTLLSAITAMIAFGMTALAPAAAQAEEISASSEVLHSGTWTKKSQRASGEWKIYTDGDATYLKLSSDFKTRNAPDLKLFLSPQAASATNNKNATEGAVLISLLESNKGEQVYTIPAGVDLSSFRSVLIHCEQYSKLWSAADL